MTDVKAARHEPIISTMLPLQPIEIGTAASYARLAAQTQSQRLWAGQSMGIETHQIFAALASRGLGLEFGSAVALAQLSHPLASATHARSVASLSGAPYIAGFGPGAAAFQRMVRGTTYPSPLAAMEQYLTIMREYLDGKIPHHVEGEWHAVGLDLPEMDSAPVELGLGVLRPRMAELAGRCADWAITWLAPPSFIKSTLRPAMNTAAARAGRPEPRLTAVVPCALNRSNRDLGAVAFHAVGTHLSAPHYTDMLQRAGIDVQMSDPRAGVRAVAEAGVFVSGTANEIAEQIAQYHEAGVTDVAINIRGVHVAEGTGAALSDLAEILSTADR